MEVQFEVYLRIRRLALASRTIMIVQNKNAVYVSFVHKKAHRIMDMMPVSLCMAEREGFEPSIGVKAYTPLAGERLQPLGHLSEKFLKPDSNRL